MSRDGPEDQVVTQPDILHGTKSARQETSTYYVVPIRHWSLHVLCNLAETKDKVQTSELTGSH